VKKSQNQDISQKLSGFEAICREKGLKLTHQRLEIYRELLLAKDHPTVETLYQRVKKRIPTISLDTVYRTLAMLEEADMINRIQTSEGHARFEPDYGVHHHLICRKCQNITDFTWKAFDTMPPPPEIEQWGEVGVKNIVIEGICSDCLRKEEKK